MKKQNQSNEEQPNVLIQPPRENCKVVIILSGASVEVHSPSLRQAHRTAVSLIRHTQARVYSDFMYR